MYISIVKWNSRDSGSFARLCTHALSLSRGVRKSSQLFFFFNFLVFHTLGPWLMIKWNGKVDASNALIVPVSFGYTRRYVKSRVNT